MYAGIAPSTYYYWKKNIEGFSEEMESARTYAGFLAKKSFMRGVIKDPKRALEFLKRRNREYADKSEVLNKIVEGDGKSILLDRLRQKNANKANNESKRQSQTSK